MSTHGKGVTEDKVQLMDEAAKDDLASKISDTFTAAMESDDSTPEETPAEETPAEEPTQDDVASTEADSEPEAQAESEGEDKPAEAAAKSAPILPAAYRRSLKNYEWTDEEIDNALKTGGSAFVASAAKIHNQRNRELQSWANDGRKAREAQQQQPAQSSTPPTPVATPTGLKPHDIAALKKKYGNDEIIDDLIGPVNAVIEQLNQIVPQAQQTQRATQMVQREALGKSIDDFFSSEEMASYAETYGTTSATLTDAQQAERQKVLEHADAIAGGAQQQGRRLTVGEALQYAVDAFTSGSKEKAARDALTKSLKTRNKGISLKPGTRTKPATGKADVRSTLEKKTEASLRKVFG